MRRDVLFRRNLEAIAGRHDAGDFIGSLADRCIYGLGYRAGICQLPLELYHLRLALLDVGYAGQFIVFIVVSGILFVFGRRFADRVTEKQPPGIGADRFVDQDGIVLEKIDPATNTGSVRVGQDEWRAISETGDIIPAGVPIKVTQIDGTRAVVKTIEKEES